MAWNPPVHWCNFPANQPVLLDFEWSKRAVLLVDEANFKTLKSILSALDLFMGEEAIIQNLEQERFRDQMLNLSFPPSEG